MTLLVEFEHPRAAYAFADYLLVQGHGCRVAQVEQAWHLSLDSEASEPFARQALQEFLENPGAEKYRLASWQLSQSGDSALKRPGRQALSDSYPRSGASILSNWHNTADFTRLVVMACVLVFAITIFGSDPNMLRPLFFFNDWQEMLQLSQSWRWVTPTLLHFGWLHFTFNMLWWWTLGDVIEKQQGTARITWIFLATAIVPNLAQFMESGFMFGGLSGVVYGLLGYLWIYGRVRPSYPIQISPVLIYMMVGWLLVGFSGALDTIVGPMANQAHLFGLLTGMVLAWWFARRDARSAV